MLIPFTAEYLTTVVSITVALAMLVLGVVIYLNDRKNLTNKLFAALVALTVIWIIAVVLGIWLQDYYMKTLVGRGAYASAALIALFIYHFSYHFPVKNAFKERIILVSLISIAIAFTSMFTPLMIESVERVEVGVDRNIYGWGYYLFALYFVGYIALGFYALYSKRPHLDKTQKTQTNFILTGLVAASLLAFTTNLVIPGLTKNTYVAQFGPVMILFFLLPTAYAVLRHHIFNLKVLGSEFITFIIWILLLFRVFFSSSIEEFIWNFLLLLVLIIFGTLLIRSVLKEVSQRERLEKVAYDLEAANKKLEDLDIARREFLSFASHQLKTPMTIIKGYAELAKQEEYINSPEKVRDIVTKIGKSTDQMHRLISNFLDARAIEEGKINYAFNPIDIVKLSTSVINDLRSNATDKDLELNFSSSSPSIIIKADETKLRQVIQNLVDNAIKYTDKGSIKVEIKEEKESSVVISVTDTGRGIPPDIKDKLFGQFVREGGAAKKIQGTGLGLYIAKEIVKAHKGEIRAESEGEGKGSVFIVRLPLK